MVSCPSMMNALVVLISIVLLSCAATAPATIIVLHDNEILRGSEVGTGSDVRFFVNNVAGLSCEGTMFVLSSDVSIEGTIDCNNKRKGHFIAKGKKTSWVGEGKLDDGSRFFISIGR